MHADITLAELEAILNFDAVNKELGNIRLGDVMNQKAVAARKEPTLATSPSAAAAGASAAAAAPTKASRTREGSRRSPRETEAMKAMLLSVLEAQSSGLTTPQLCDKLQAGGYKADAATATLLLRNLEANEKVQSDNGRPKTWRLAQPSQAAAKRSAMPMFIRKAAAPDADA